MANDLIAIIDIGKTNAKFDRAKLLSFNADYIGKLSDADFARRWRAFLAEYEPEALAKLVVRFSEPCTFLTDLYDGSLDVEQAAGLALQVLLGPGS